MGIDSPDAFDYDNWLEWAEANEEYEDRPLGIGAWSLYSRTRSRAKDIKDPGVWVSADGQVWPLARLSDRHLANILSVLSRGGGVDQAFKKPFLQAEQDRRTAAKRVDDLLFPSDAPYSRKKDENMALYQVGKKTGIINLMTGGPDSGPDFFRTPDDCVWMFDAEVEVVTLLHVAEGAKPKYTWFSGVRSWGVWESNDISVFLDSNPEYVHNSDEYEIYAERIPAPSIVVPGPDDSRLVTAGSLGIGCHFMHDEKLYRRVHPIGTESALPVTALDLELGKRVQFATVTRVEPVEVTIAKK